MSAGRSINTQSQSWGTPHKYVEAVKKVFGGQIDLDPCSNEYLVVNAKVEYLLPEKDGLVGSWNYSAMIYWGNHINTFYDVFIDYGAVVDISNLIGVKIGSERKYGDLFSF